METGRLRPEQTGELNGQAGTHGIGKHSCKYRLFKSERGLVR